MNKFVLCTTATAYASRRLAKAVMKIIADSIDDKDQLFNFDLALSEACANVVRHAYKDIDPSKIEIVLTLHYGERIEIEISDWGHGFSKLPVEPKNADPQAEGGRGLYIMSELADDFVVKKEGIKNTIYLNVNIEETSWKPLE